MLNFLDNLTSGRLATGSNFLNRFYEVLNSSPLFGSGFGSTISADFAFIEVLYIGGVVGLILFCLIYVFKK